MFIKNYLSSSVSDIDHLASKMEASATDIKAQGSAFNMLCTSLMDLVNKECQNYSEYFGRIVTNFNAITNAYYKCADLHLRAADDLKDISTRRAVVQRMEKDIDTTRKKLDAVVVKQTSLEAINPLTPSQMNQLQEAKTMKVELATQLKGLLVAFKEYKPKFDKFVFNRVKSAYEHYGQGLEIKGSLELSMYNSVMILFRSIRDHAKNPQQIISSYKPQGVQPDIVVKDTPNPAPQEEAPKKKKAPAKKKPRPKNSGEPGEIEIKGFMYDGKMDEEEKQQNNHPNEGEKTENKDLFTFDDEDKEFNVSYQVKKQEPEPFNPEIDESKLDVNEIAKELNLE